MGAEPRSAADAAGREPGQGPAALVDELVLDVVTPGAAAGLHNCLDLPGPPPADGEALPPLWHWLAFLPRVAQRELGPDGHPDVAHLLPAGFSRRMLAGGRLQLPSTAHVGAKLRRQSSVASMVEKAGRSGPLLFLTLHHVVFEGDAVVVREEQDIVYRPADGLRRQEDASTSWHVGGPANDGWPWERELRTDAALLFRFSALTYNAHRIHYDRDYARETEGFPGLVVQGPLQAVAMAELCRHALPDSTVVSFQFRALRPAFEGETLVVRGRPVEEGVELEVLDEGRLPTAQGRAVVKTEIR